MYGDIYGIQGGMPWAPATLSVMCVLQFIMIFTIFVISIIGVAGGWSKFENLPDYGIGQRRDIIAAIPAYEELSLLQKVDAAVEAATAAAAAVDAASVDAGVTTSQLTGSRDIPVFFQDYDIEAVRSKNGAVTTAREGFSGKADNDLEKALAGH